MPDDQRVFLQQSHSYFQLYCAFNKVVPRYFWFSTISIHYLIYSPTYFIPLIYSPHPELVSDHAHTADRGKLAPGMAPAKKKTPKSKKRKQLASSFKKQNLTPTGSGKNFKKSRSAAKRKQNLSSASAFNASGLSPSKASTPLVKPGRPKSKRNIVDNVFKGNRPAQSPATDEKAPPSTPSTSATANNVESPCPTFPTPVPSVGQDLKNLNDYIARRGQDEFQEVPVQAKTKPTLQDLARNKNSRKRKRVRCGPGPPKGKVLKGDLGDMFR